MNFFFDGLLIVLLMIIFFQDLKFRAIHIVLPVILGALGIYLFLERGLQLQIVLYNIIFLALTFLGLFLYLSLKNRSVTNILSAVGMGDLLFFLAITPFFSTSNFILFFIGGMVFTIIIHSILIKFTTHFELIPLAGFVALFMILLKVTSYVVDFDFFKTVWI